MSKASLDLNALIDAIKRYQALETIGQMGWITHIAPLDCAGEDAIAFARRDARGLETTQAGALILHPDDSGRALDVPKILVEDPYLAYASISALFARTRRCGTIDPSAQIHPSAVIEPGAQVGAGCVISAGAFIDACVTLGTNVAIGAGCIIGGEGFGFAPHQGKWVKIHQLGGVIIGDNVRIGGNVCIDRGALGDTTIANDVIIDNLVQIAHNVQIGQGCAIAAKTGIAGSAKIGAHCLIGGMCGIAGHLVIAPHVTLTAMSMVTKSITQAGSYSSGTPVMPTPKWHRALAYLKRQIKP